MSSLTRVQGELASLVHQLEALPCEFVNPIAIRKSKEAIQVVHEHDNWGSWLSTTTKHYFWSGVDKVSSLFGKRLPPEPPKLDEKDGLITWHYFDTIFGDKRVETKTNFFKADIRKLFLQIADLSWPDLVELFKEIKNPELKSVRFLSEAETVVLRQELADTPTLEMVPGAGFKGLLDILCPFKKVDHIFLNHVPTVRRFPFIRETFFEEERDAKRLLITHTMRDLPADSALWESYFGKDLPALNLLEDDIIPHREGIFRVFRNIDRGGAFVLLFKSYGSALNVIMCRGTIFKNWASLKENACLPDGGIIGHKATVGEVEKYLADPKLGFVKTAHESVRGIGYSKGAAQLALLIANQTIKSEFPEATYICGLGVSFETAAALTARLHTYKQRPNIRHIWENGDVIPEFGEAHPGLNVPSSIAFVEQLTIYDEVEKEKCLKRMLRSEKYLVQAGLFAWNLAVWGHHTREIIGRDVHFKQINNTEKKGRAILDKRLLCDPLWESGRRFANYLFSPVVELRG